MVKFTFNNSDNAFFTELKSEVDAYFASKKLQKTGNWKLYLKSIILMPAAVLTYGIYIYMNLSTVETIFVAMLLGVICASIGFNVMHDACHESYSMNKTLNYFMGLSLNLLGGTAFIWKQKHNIIHHTYTNIDGLDDDIAKAPLLRHCDTQPWVPMHKYQHIYLPLAYSITSFAWTFIMDFEKYFKQKVYRTPLQNMNIKEHIVFWISKVLNVLIYIAIPIIAKGVASWAVFYVSMHLCLGLILALVFQLAHVVEGTEFAHIEEENIKSEESWAVHQVKTTSNFATQNIFANWYMGGLNFQIEHHLFPRISHVHYPALSPIVEKICEKYGLRYNNIPTTRKAIISHFKTMRKFGQAPELKLV